jgi:hypothetical protein
VSNPVVFTVNGGSNPPTLASVTPNNGDPGASVNVTLAGTNFTTSSSVNVSGGDISVTNLNVVNNSSITATLNIGAAAAGGARNVSVTTGAGTSGNATFTVNGTGLSVTTTSLPSGTVGVAYSSSVSATGGTAPYTWAVVGGSLPSGLNLDPNTGAIAGTPGVAAAGTTSFTVQVTDSAAQTASKPLSITVNSNPPSVTTGSLPNGQVGVVYNSSVAATGGVTPYTWGLISGALPNNLNLDPNTGAITGTPNTQGNYNFTVQVTDAYAQTASKPLSITINPNAPTVQTTSLPNGTVGVAYSSSVTATGGTPPYTWSVVVGSLPAGLNLNPSTGAISGTPGVAAAGTTSFTVQAADSLNQTGTKPLSITIAANPPSITTASLPGGTVGTAYSQGLAASGGVLPYTWSISVGTLPNGLNLNSNSGAITGTPTAAGTFNFTATVTDALGQTAPKALSIVVNNPPAPTLNPLVPNKGQQGTAVTLNFTGTNFVPRFTTLTTTAPGVTISNLNISSPTAGTAVFTIAANTPVNDTWTVTLTTPGGASNIRYFGVYGVPSLTSLSPASGTRGTSLTVTISGSQLLYAHPQFSCSGISSGSQSYNSTFTQITTTFTIASTATMGPCSVTMANAAGASNAVTFTVN